IHGFHDIGFLYIRQSFWRWEWCTNNHAKYLYMEKETENEFDVCFFKYHSLGVKMAVWKDITKYLYQNLPKEKCVSICQ
ncbi:MAG: hypothetical protein ABSA26_17985, partial [Thermoguttaceae bacterium]